MSLLHRSTRRRAAGAPVAPPPASSDSQSVGFNVTSDSYYDGAGKHSNILWEATHTTPVANLTTHGYPKAGNSATYLIYASNWYLWNQYKPGTYVIKGTGTGATITPGGVACSPTTATPTTLGVPFRREVTIAAMAGPVTADELIRFPRQNHFTLTVSSAGTADMDDLVVCHIDDEAHQAAGGPASQFTLDAIASYSTVSQGYLRMMQFTQMSNGTFMQDPADIPLDGTVAIATGWSSLNTANDGRRGTKNVKMPSPETQARIAVACNMKLWVNTHAQMTDAALAEFFTRMAPIYTSGPIIVECVNEPWNSRAGYWAHNSGYLGLYYGSAGQPGAGAGLATSTAQSSVNASLGHASLRAWKQAELVFGSRVVRVMNVQLGWVDNSKSSLEYVDPGIIQAGQTIGQLMHSATVATYFGLTPDRWQTGPGSSRGIVAPGQGLGISKRWLVQNPATTTPLWIEKAWRNSVDQTLYFAGLWNTYLAGKGYPLIEIEYEGHQAEDSFAGAGMAKENVANGDGVTPAGDASIAFAFNATTGALTLTTTTFNGISYSDAARVLTDYFNTGDIIGVTWTGAAPGLADSRTYKVKVVGAEMFAFTTQANYDANTPVTGGSNKNSLVANITKTAAWAELVNETWWSNPSAIDGQSLIDYQHEQMRTFGFRIAAGFKCLGSALHPFYTASDSVARVSTSANKPHGHWYPDTALATRYKHLT